MEGEERDNRSYLSEKQNSDRKNELFDKLLMGSVQAVEERMKERKDIHSKIIRGIDTAIKKNLEAIWRLEALFPSYSVIDVSEKKSRYMARIDALEREKRQEMLRFWRDGCDGG